MEYNIKVKKKEFEKGDELIYKQENNSRKEIQ